MVRRTSEWRRAFCATAVPAALTTAVPKLCRVSWNLTCLGIGLDQAVGFPQRGQVAGAVRPDSR